MPAPQITIDALTTAPRDGAGQASGTFDILIRALKEHLHEEYEAGRVVGREFATLYLGAIQATLGQAADFVFRSQQLNLDAQLKDQQLALGAVEIQKAQAQVLQIQAQNALLEQQRLNAIQEGQNLAAQKLQIEAQTLLLGSQKLVADQQKINLADELLMSEKQRGKIDQEMANMASQRSLIDQQVNQVIAQVALTTSQQAQIVAETANLGKQGEVLDQTRLKLVEDTQVSFQQWNLLQNQNITAPLERQLVSTQILKVSSERDLIGKKIMTEQAQYSGDGVSTDSLIGRQKELYLAQTQGFTRDAEQKAVKILVDTWNVRRTTDEGTVADATNKLQDSVVGAAVAKLMQGIGVTV